MDTANRTSAGALNYPLKVSTTSATICEESLSELHESSLLAQLFTEKRALRCRCARYPQVEVSEDGIKQEESEFNPAFIARLLPKLDWSALRKIAAEVSARMVNAGRSDGAYHGLKWYDIAR